MWYNRRVQNVTDKGGHYFLDGTNANAAAHSFEVDSGTFLLSINGVQDSPEEAVRTHSTFSGTLS